MADRINLMRKLLVDGLQKQGSLLHLNAVCPRFCLLVICSSYFAILFCRLHQGLVAHHQPDWNVLLHRPQRASGMKSLPIYLLSFPTFNPLLFQVCFNFIFFST